MPLDYGKTVTAVLSRATDIALHSPDHGPRHWRDVARIAHALWAEGTCDDHEALFLFALLHDSQRENEYDDPQHGARAAALLTELCAGGVIELDEPDATDKHPSPRFWMLVEALTKHEHGHTATREDAAGRVIGTCWDADRLNLWRVGIAPDERFLSTALAHEHHVRNIFRVFTQYAPDKSWDEIADAYEEHRPLDILPSIVHYLRPETNEAHKAFAQDTHGYQMFKRMFRPEELCDELRPYVIETGVLGKWLKHPLVHQHYLEPHDNHRVNVQYRTKVGMLEDYAVSSNGHGYVYVHERPYRADALERVLETFNLTHSERLELIRSVWTDTENIHENLHVWESIFEEVGPGELTDADEREAFDALPDELTIYRGTAYEDGMGTGYSWTLDRAKAAWFARRLFAPERHDAPRVLTGTVPKAEVYGYTDGRGESEIIVDPDNVTLTGNEVIGLEPDKLMVTQPATPHECSSGDVSEAG